LDTPARVILIGGTSNLGKSTVAEAIAARLGRRNISTDRMARHPGRPWAVAPNVVPPHVVTHYRELDAGALTAAQIAHYQRMWPIVEAFARYHRLPEVEPIVLEGSGIWPDNVAALGAPDVSAIWLTGAPELIAGRIRNESGYATADATGRLLIDKFIARSQGYDVRMMERVRALGLPFITVTPETSVEALAEESLERMQATERGAPA
jgi:hypothetical protein